MDRKRPNNRISSENKRKFPFLSDDFIPFSDFSDLPSSSNPPEDHRPKDNQQKSKNPKKERSDDRRTNGELPRNDQRSNGLATGMRLFPTGQNTGDRKFKMEEPNDFLVDGIEVIGKSKRKKINKKARTNQSAADKPNRSPVRSTTSGCSSEEFNFKPPILVGASPVTLVNPKNGSPVKLNDVAAAKQIIVDNSDKASTITLDDDEEESPENKRTTSFCQSEESIDLNDLRGITGFNDFDLSDLKHDDTSSYSSYCTIVDDSDEPECEPSFGFIASNIDINKQQKFTKSPKEAALSVGGVNRMLPANLDAFNNYTNPLYIIDRAPKSSPSSSAQPGSSANVKPLSNHSQKTTQAFGHTTNTSELDKSNQLYPWVRKQPYHGSMIGLHEEIEDFYEYSHLKPSEIQVRNLLFLKVKNVILTRWPDAQVLVFGSFQTGLSLPFADLDIVVINDEYGKKIPFYQLEHRLVQEGITTFNNVKIITKALVPIIKFIHNETGLNVDLSFNCDDGPKIIGLIKQYIQMYPALPKLLLIIKLMLHQRDLNFSYTGGLSSYSLTLMIVNFFQQHPRTNISQGNGSNLGVLLLEFLELYGFALDYKAFAVRVRNCEGFVRKGLMSCLKANELSMNRLCVEDPLDEFNNVSKNSHRWDDIRKAFRNSYNVLVERCTESGKLGRNKSILGELISYTPAEVEIRRRVLEFHSKELEPIVKKKSRKTVCLDLNRDFIPFSVPDEPLGAIDYPDEEEELIVFR